MNVQNPSSTVTSQAPFRPHYDGLEGVGDERTITITNALAKELILPRESVGSKGLPRQEPIKSLKRPLPPEADPKTHSVSPRALPAKKATDEMRVRFLHGTDEHIETYANCIDKAESHVIIASWNLKFIPRKIFDSLMRAKRRGISISFVVQSVLRDATLNCFKDEEDGGSDYHFDLFETKSHAKFLFVDSKRLVLGSYNALGDSYEESLDASFLLEGTVSQLWPYYMSIYETYTSIGEDLGSIFCGIAMISKSRNPGPRPLLQRRFEDGSQIFLLRTIKEHEEFLVQAMPHNGDATIYSPFSTKDNTLKRLQALERMIPSAMKVSFKVLPKFKNGLTRLLSMVPNLKGRVSIEEASSHQKVVILGTQTICLGSLNWLSAAQDAKVSYSNAELSIVLQGPKAERIIKDFY